MSQGNPKQDSAAEQGDRGDTGDTKPTVVGIGASAGALAALRTLFTHVPADSGVAWVVVVHLSPEHPSHLHDLLQLNARIPVQQVTGTVPVEADRVYVIPPGFNLDAVGTHLRLSTLEKEQPVRAPVDHFFRTLAATHDGHSVGVILTGTGSDGSIGIKAIKESNGFTIVQDPSEAEQPGMPQSALSTGVVDRVLKLDEIAGAVLRYVRTRPRVGATSAGGDIGSERQHLLNRVLGQVRARTGRDFTRYRGSTIVRRVERRMQIREVEELQAYLQLLTEDAQETRNLADDLLIPVTSFFRDPAVWTALQREVLPGLLDRMEAGETIRVWSAGCATGEEAYSLAIALLEEVQRRGMPARFQVFASDLHERSLDWAREGYYPGDIGIDVGTERLGRFFHKEDGGYRVRKEVRDRVVFASHDMLSDPPFSRLDMVMCRNVLIYLERWAQRKLLEVFHYALQPGGYMVLGTAESAGETERFRLHSKEAHLYRREHFRGPDQGRALFPLLRPAPSARDVARSDQAISQSALHLRLLEEYAPPSMLVAPDGRVAHVSAGAGRYLRHPGGEATVTAFRLVRAELRVELRAALHAARERHERTRSRPIAVQMGAEQMYVILEVSPARDPQHDGYVLVVFREARGAAVEMLSREAGEVGDAGLELHMEARLGRTEGRLHDLISDYESSREELRASNEELQSANEELRTTLEELETSKEELHSVNEELQTVNEENRQRVEELAQLAADLQNLLASTDIATLFLDRDMRILRFTPRAAELFNVRSADRGRPLFELSNRLGYAELDDDAARVLRTLVPVEREVEGEGAASYLARVLPYRTDSGHVAGVVITFVDITQLKSAERALLESEENHRLIVESALDYAILTTDPEGTVESWSPGAEAVFGWCTDEMIGQSSDLTFTPGDRARGEPEKERHTARTEGWAPDVRWHLRRDGTRVFIEGMVRKVVDPSNGRLRGFVKIGQDRTERRQMEEALRELNQTLEQRVAERTAELEQESAARRSALRQLVTTEEDERRRISRELHDQMGQHLTGLLLGLRSAQGEATSQKLVERLRELEQLAGQTARDMQNLAVELRPPALDRLGLEAALQDHLEQWTARYGIEHDFHGSGLDGARLSLELETTLYRVAQEALNNVLKHAQATHVALILERRAGLMRLVVEDDGQGFDVERVISGSGRVRRLGLVGMRERVALLGGEVEIESSEGQGTTLFVRIPVDNEGED